MKEEFIFAIAVVGLPMLGLYFLLKYFQNTSYKVVAKEKVSDLLGEYIFTLENSKGNTVRYRGSSTVWHNADTGRRVSTSMEYFLSEVFVKQRWNEQDAKRKENI